jgi:purine-binding chemotaxis protein CheW
MTHTRQLCTFVLHDLHLGVEVDRVQEVLRYQEMTRVPLAPPVVEGLINLRGQIVTAIDLRRRLGLPERASDRRPMNVVVRTEDGIVSLLVDEIGDVLEVGTDSFEAPPATLRGPARDLIRGVHKLDRQLLLLLDVEQTLNCDAGAAALNGTNRN